MIREMIFFDVDKVVAVHLASFPGFFLSFLGTRPLALFYSWIGSADVGAFDALGTVDGYFRFYPYNG